MEHLALEDVMEFVSMHRLSAESLELAGRVTAHIRTCDRCLRQVTAFQRLYDEFAKADSSGDFRAYLQSRLGTDPSVDPDDAL